MLKRFLVRHAWIPVWLEAQGLSYSDILQDMADRNRQAAAVVQGSLLAACPCETCDCSTILECEGANCPCCNH